MVAPQSVDTEPDEPDEKDPAIKEAMKQWKAANPDKTLKEQRMRRERGLIDHLPWMDLIADNEPHRASNTGFGSSFPAEPVKGDVFVRVDRLPNLVYKFNGHNWIEIDKSVSTTYAYDTAYIDYLIQQIEQGQYDPELLSPQETDLIAQRINQDDRSL